MWLFLRLSILQQGTYRYRSTTLLVYLVVVSQPIILLLMLTLSPSVHTKCSSMVFQVWFFTRRSYPNGEYGSYQEFIIYKDTRVHHAYKSLHISQVQVMRCTLTRETPRETLITSTSLQTSICNTSLHIRFTALQHSYLPH